MLHIVTLKRQILRLFATFFSNIDIISNIFLWGLFFCTIVRGQNLVHGGRTIIFVYHVYLYTQQNHICSKLAFPIYIHRLFDDDESDDGDGLVI